MNTHSNRRSKGFYDPEFRKPRENIFLTVIITATFTAGLFFTLTSTLDDMTERACRYGIRQACEELE